jgi:hypothetical protein
MKDIKGYHNHIFSSSDSTIETNSGYTVSPVIVAGGLPYLAILRRQG